MASSTASVLSAKQAKLEEPKQSNIPVEKIVIENNLKFEERELQMMKSVKEVLFASSVSTTNNPSDDCSILASILKNLVKNQAKHVKRCNDETKSLFATLLDYGGPALARIVTEKLSGPSLQTMYRSARSDYAIPMTLQERTLERAAHFYRTIGYRGVFALAVDATAIIPTP